MVVLSSTLSAFSPVEGHSQPQYLLWILTPQHMHATSLPVSVLRLSGKYAQMPRMDLLLMCPGSNNGLPLPCFLTGVTAAQLNFRSVLTPCLIPGLISLKGAKLPNIFLHYLITQPQEHVVRGQICLHLCSVLLTPCHLHSAQALQGACHILTFISCTAHTFFFVQT